MHMRTLIEPFRQCPLDDAHHIVRMHAQYLYFVSVLILYSERATYYTLIYIYEIHLFLCL